jgi:hypothetical protein
MTDLVSLLRELDLRTELEEITDWLDNRPSASMDPSIEEREKKISRMHEIKSELRGNKIRPESHMMESQGKFLDD